MSAPDTEPKDEPKDEPVKPTNEQITDSLFSALQGDDSLTDEDRKAISEGLNSKTGGKPPAAVKPESDHWSTRKLW